MGVNASWSQSNPALYYLREMINDLPHDVRLVEFTIKDAPGDILARVVGAQPEVIGISSYIWNREYLADLIFELRKNLPDARLLIGGPEAKSLAENLPMRSHDTVVRGAGESLFRDLAAKDFEVKKALSDPSHVPLRDIPFPYRDSDVSRLAGHLVYYESSRGCPFTCAYCLSATDTRLEYRFDPHNHLEIKKMQGELDALVVLNPRTVKFVDRSFNLNHALARAIWNHIQTLDCSCDFHFEIYPLALEDDDFNILSRMPQGRIRLETGVQSVHDRSLNSIGRCSNWARIKPKLNRLQRDTKAHIHSDLLIGLPGETLNDVAQSINEMMQTLPHELQLGTLKILPDTPMLEIAAELGYEWDDQSPYQVRRTDALSFEDIRYLKEIARIINLYWNRKNHVVLIRDLISGCDAYDLFAQIHRIHQKRGLDFWGVSAALREEILTQIHQTQSFS